MSDALMLVHMEGADPGPLLAALASRCEVETISIAAPAGLARLASAPALIDVDLADPAVVLALRRHLPRGGEHARVIVVDPARAAEAVQAGIFGATARLFRPYSIADAVFEIERILVGTRTPELTFDRGLGRGAVPLGAPGRPSILAAEEALCDLFTACLNGGEVDHVVLAEASSQITGSVAEIGFDAWMETVRRHHSGTFQHCMLVTGIAVGFGAELGMSTVDLERLAQAGLAHDLGKARVPLEILDKPGKVTPEEFAVIKEHPGWGWEALMSTGKAIDPAVLDAVLHHHEALDGSGYPDGLSGRRIADVTRVMSVCDIYGALSERRAYKPAMEPAKIMEIMNGLAEQGKLEKALVRALHWVVMRERPGGFVGQVGQLRSA